MLSPDSALLRESDEFIALISKFALKKKIWIQKKTNADGHTQKGLNLLAVFVGVIAQDRYFH